jgi:putative SOS response-associated peptidase YedK
MRWGLIPHWCKSLDQAQELSLYGLNARAETVSEKPLFRDVWQSKPCLVPVGGFFEWQSQGKQKQPYFIHAADRQPLLMAGLYSSWLDTQTGEEVQSYAILTTEANALMAEIHNLKKRMPVILTSDEAKQFLAGSEPERTQYLKPCAEGLLEAYPVGKWLNQVKVNRNVASALEPIEKDFPQTLF